MIITSNNSKQSQENTPISSLKFKINSVCIKIFMDC